MSIRNRWAVTSLFILMVLPRMGLAATGGGILGEGSIDSAGSTELMAEIRLYESIHEGIALLLANCEMNRERCIPAVSRDELARIIAVLDTRIETLRGRVQRESGSAALDKVLAAYIRTRQKYLDFTDNLERILPKPAGLDNLSPGVQPQPQELDIFRDADEEIEDD